MKTRDVVVAFWEAMHRNEWRAAGEFLHDDYLLEWPQSGERIRGRDNFAAVNANYPAAGRWRFTVHRLITSGDTAASDVEVTDGVIQARAISFFELRDSVIWRVTEFWPDPFPPAEWRSPWVERADAVRMQHT